MFLIYRKLLQEKQLNGKHMFLIYRKLLQEKQLNGMFLIYRKLLQEKQLNGAQRILSFGVWILAFGFWTLEFVISIRILRYQKNLLFRQCKQVEKSNHRCDGPH
jgi:hypothetical protein